MTDRCVSLLPVGGFAVYCSASGVSEAARSEWSHITDPEHIEPHNDPLPSGARSKPIIVSNPELFETAGV